jgi:Spy/CpxP family protein refolding chaperone
MKRVTSSVALSLGLMLVLGGMFPAQGGMMGPAQMGQPGQGMEPRAGAPEGMMGPQMMQHMMRGMMGGGMGPMCPHMMPQMMGGMEGDMPEGMTTHRPSQMLRLLRTELDLSDEQAQKVKEILFQVMKANIKQHADLRIAELELQGLLEADAVEMGNVESKLKAIEGLRTTLRLNIIKAHEQVKGLLTPEQRQKLERLHDRMLGMRGSGMMGMRERMQEGGAGGMGMMGGGMERQPQSRTQMPGAPRNVTQKDTQGAVTVEVTLLTPDQPRADGKLAVQVKLDTHAVDLDQYQLEKLAVLRDGQGREVQALSLESASGSGHHREGVLTFPGTDASGKPVLGPEAKAFTLILRGIGGVPERVFRWQLPLG